MSDALPVLETSLVIPLGLHLADGVLSWPVLIVAWVAFVLIMGYTLLRAGKRLGNNVVPVAGILGAFIFAAQIINFPILPGVAVHLVGGALAAILLGLPVAILIMVIVVLLQALLLHDGGIVALAANAINLAIIAPLVGSLMYATITRLLAARAGKRGKMFATGVAGWASVIAATVVLALELVISGTADLLFLAAALVPVYALLGIVEGAITAGAYALVVRARIPLAVTE